MFFVGSPSPLRRHRLFTVLLAAGLAVSGLGLKGATTATGTGHGRVMFPNSVHSIPATSTGRGPEISRTTLTDSESAEVQTIEVALKMHHFDELQARVAKGEQVSRAELASRYFPTQAEEDQVVTWLTSEGLAVSRTDADHLAVFVKGTVAQISKALGVQYARVTNEGREYSSAISAPNIASDVAGVVAGVHGLQAHLRPKHLAILKPQASRGFTGYKPNQIINAYGGSGITQTGLGETIAIYALRYPANSDLSSFWTAVSSSQVTGNVTHVDVAGGPATTADTDDNTSEADLDVEWAGAIAPGAKIRIYCGNETDESVNDELLQQVIADLSTNSSIHELSISFAEGEEDLDHDYLIIEAQYMATLASSGVSVFCSSGDNGNRDGTTQSGAIEALTPASDPSVTAVGGTTLTLDTNNNILTETAWADSGGGYSTIFARPSWQSFTSANSTGIAANGMRCVPDVAMDGDPETGLFDYDEGTPSVIGGTSAGAPIWSGITALLNQQREAAGQGLLGCLNPRLYPLNQTSSFHPITSGNNGYAAGAGYNLVTGLGTPVLSSLFVQTLSTSSAPVITGQLPSPIVTVDQPATLFVDVLVANLAQNPVTYQWQRSAGGTAAMANISDGSSYTGSNAALLVVAATASSNSGDKYQCVVSNSSGTATSAPVTLTVNATGVTTLAGWPEAGGAVDATGWKARFSWVGGVKYDPLSSALYVADSTNCLVRKVTLAGVVTTVAGVAGKAGSNDGSTSTALLNNPGGVAIDSTGNIYVADSLNYTIRKISNGTVSTLAGMAGQSGHVDATGTAAQFVDPENIAVDSTGNVYVADGAGYTVRKVTPAGVVTTVAGSGKAGRTNGQGTAASFGLVYAVALDSAGNLYVADGDYNEIRKIDTSGNVTLLAGSSSGSSGTADGAGTAARFDAPSGLCVDASNNLFVADSTNGTIREITPAGVVSTVAGQTSVLDNLDGPPLQSGFSTPTEVAVDSFGVLYVSDGFNNTVRRVVLSSSAVGPPTIVTQPASATVTAGSSASFSVTASGEGPLSFQWTFGGSNISGATSATYSISSAASSNAGNYAVVVSNAYGSTTSNTATLTVNASSSGSTSTGTGSTASSGGGGGGGGGGAPSDWFLLALGGLAAVRAVQRKRLAR